MTRGDSRSSNQDKAELAPGSSVTAGPRSDIDEPNLLSQETLEELVSWKAKAEQQLMEMSEDMTWWLGQKRKRTSRFSYISLSKPVEHTKHTGGERGLQCLTLEKKVIRLSKASSRKAIL
ncbi:hypothetical protein Bca52824_029393 [Brassica carinata]|uniref:Uncharacterized protein n=1 Tax=Brassica carinata TaxID=52824 RepID=A0A8X7VER2_BRACI|nr:hypothetical protein Bca52824_029393 [Brassica carinata]